MAAGEFRQRAFGAEQPAPGPAEHHHAQENEGPPHAPEHELRQQRDVRPEVRRAVRQRQRERHRFSSIDAVIIERRQHLEGNHNIADERDLDPAGDQLPIGHPVLAVLQGILEIGIH